MQKAPGAAPASTQAQLPQRHQRLQPAAQGQQPSERRKGPQPKPTRPLEPSPLLLPLASLQAQPPAAGVYSCRRCPSAEAAVSRLVGALAWVSWVTARFQLPVAVLAALQQRRRLRLVRRTQRWGLRLRLTELPARPERYVEPQRAPAAAPPLAPQPRPPPAQPLALRAVQQQEDEEEKQRLAQERAGGPPQLEEQVVLQLQQRQRILSSVCSP